MRTQRLTWISERLLVSLLLLPLAIVMLLIVIIEGNSNRRHQKAIAAAELLGAESIRPIFINERPFFEVRFAYGWPGARYSLAELRHLRGDLAIDLSGGQILEEHVSQLAQIDGLVILRAEGTPITDAALKRLTNARIEELYLGRTKISDKGLAQLGLAKRLKSLDLEDTSISDDGLRFLANSDSIESIVLRGTRVTDAGVMHLLNMKSLKNLDIVATRVTSDGLRRFTAARPDVSLVGSSDSDLKALCTHFPELCRE